MTDTVREAFEAYLEDGGRCDHLGNYIADPFDLFKAGRESMREEAIKAVDEQHLLDNTGEDTDYAYTNAINHAIDAIKELP